MNLFQILEVFECEGEVLTLISFIKTIFTLVQIAIPGVLIVLGTIDMFKAMTSGDEKKTQAARSAFIKRLIYAVVAFLIPFIIRLVFNWVSSNIVTGSDDLTAKSAQEQFFACWNGGKKSSSGSSNEKKSCWIRSKGEWYNGSASSASECDRSGANYDEYCWGTERDCKGSN